MRTSFSRLSTTFRIPHLPLTSQPAPVGGVAVYAVPLCTPPRRKTIPPPFQEARDEFREFTLRHILPTDQPAGAGLSPSIARHTPFAAPCIQCLRGWPLVSPDSWQHLRDRFRPLVSHDPHGALYRNLVSANGYPNHMCPSLVRDSDVVQVRIDFDPL